mgnify:CR=1 FL=1
MPYTDYSGDKAKAFGDFESAIQINANDPDIYYHRGQSELERSRVVTSS